MKTTLEAEAITISMIANQEVTTTSDVVEIANRIQSLNLQFQFDAFRASYEYANDSIYELQDCVRDFAYCNVETRLYHQNGIDFIRFSAMTKEISLGKLSDYIFGHKLDDMDKLYYLIPGNSNRIPVNSYLFHQCFAEGRISVDELIAYSLQTVNE